MRFTLATTGELAPGERKPFELDGRRIVLFNIAGEYYCIADVCSHDGGPVAEGECDGFEIECPRHGARFDVRDGKVLSFPAIRDIPAYPVSVVDQKVRIDIDES
ncbi:MAG TPA: non-heme iron oxygenase ferredoxin subunit [Anaerolineales bacterium]|nr:non-heme iron oxygenase ferredoxin subunit [Anaerolineales bacterium]